MRFGVVVVSGVGYVFSVLMCENSVLSSWKFMLSMMLLNIFMLIMLVCVCRYVNGSDSMSIMNIVNGYSSLCYSVML